MRLTAAAALSCLAVLASACGNGGSSAATSAAPPAAGNSTAPAAPQPAKNLTADQVAQALKAHGIPLRVVKVYTAADDPNHQLGRPGGYSSKIAFSDSRAPANPPGAASDAMARGGSVEVFPDHDGAVKRAQYIQTVTRAAPIVGLEYDYVAGGVLVRVSGNLTPDIATGYASALAAIAGPVVTPSPVHT